MNVQDLIDQLEKLPRDLDIRVLVPTMEDEENLWVVDVDVSKKGESGFEVYGEVRLITSE